MAGSGQIAQVGAQITLNVLCGNAALNDAFSLGDVRYLTLLTASPAEATTASELIEVTGVGSTPAYTRTLVTFSAASAAYPSVVFNSALVTWGPYIQDMLVPAQWVALVDTGPAAGTSGNFLYWWYTPSPIQAPGGQPIQIPTGGLIPGSGLILDQA